MQRRQLGKTGLEIAPLVLGGNVFGWTADRQTSFAILDAFFEAGFNAIDTADVYNRYVPGLVGGESEAIIGEWMKARGNRDRIVLVTKGGLAMAEGAKAGLGAAYLRRACEASLKRLQTDYIDVYLAHKADPATPFAETAGAFQRLIDEGKVRAAGGSNYSAQELEAVLGVSEAGLARYQVFEPHYNLAERDRYEGATEDLCVRHALGVITYYSLAAGFLTGKYRTKEDASGRPRSRVVSNLVTPEKLKLLDALDRVAARHGATPAQVALAWIMARPSVTAPVASATSLAQLTDIMGAAELSLTPEDFSALG
jgi:aryl-alcohol dehydrogenase-like predicted oxidoreductase